jgi:hypothetical protein
VWERQEDMRARHAEHITEVGTGSHQQEFDHVAEGFAPFKEG